MATTKATKEPGIQLIEGAKGSLYRVQIRLKGHKPVSKNFDTFQKAKAWKHKTIAALKTGQPYETTEMRRFAVGDLIDRFIKNELKKLRNHRTMQGHLLWWKKEIGYCTLTQLHEDLIARARDKVKQEPDHLGYPRSAATVNRYICSLRSVITLAVREWRLLQTSPLKNLRKLAEPRGRERFLSKEEKARLLQACQESSCKLLYPIVLLALSTGMRKGEILGLKWKDIDLDTGRITMHHTKNGDRRVVPVKGMALTQLKHLSTHCQGTNHANEYLFCLKQGGKPINFRGSWETALKRAKIKDFTFHDTRHDYITSLSELGFPLHVISRIVGHRSHTITTCRYSHLSLEHAEQAATEIGAELEKNYVHLK